MLDPLHCHALSSTSLCFVLSIIDPSPLIHCSISYHISFHLLLFVVLSVSSVSLFCLLSLSFIASNVLLFCLLSFVFFASYLLSFFASYLSSLSTSSLSSCCLLPVIITSNAVVLPIHLCLLTSTFLCFIYIINFSCPHVLLLCCCSASSLLFFLPPLFCSFSLLSFICSASSLSSFVTPLCCCDSSSSLSSFASTQSSLLFIIVFPLCGSFILLLPIVVMFHDSHHGINCILPMLVRLYKKSSDLVKCMIACTISFYFGRPFWTRPTHVCPSTC